MAKYVKTEEGYVLASELENVLPDITANDEDKFLVIVNGKPTWVALPVAEEAEF